MDKKTISNKIIKLTRCLSELDVKYYSDANSVVSDKEYDKLFNELKTLEDKYPELLSGKPYTSVINDSVRNGIDTNQHGTSMLSMGNVFNDSELIYFVTKIKKQLDLPTETNIEFTCEPKIDGLALSLVYVNGVLARATTRGNGVYGESVLERALEIKSIPHKLLSYKGEPIPKYMDIRGEVYMSLDAFLVLNKSQKDNGRKMYSNPRNAAAGALRTIHVNKKESKPLEFIPYGVSTDSSYRTDTQMGDLDYLYDIGFKCPGVVTIVDNIPDMLYSYSSIVDNSGDYDYGIDGVVYNVNKHTYRLRLGYTNRQPKSIIAYKLQTTKKKSTVKEIVVQVGKTGAITPVAIITPVNIDDVTVTRATLHNENKINELGIGVGSIIEIQRAGDVVPEITKVIENPIGEYVMFKMPKKCPSCGYALNKSDNESITYCDNDEYCGEQIIGRLIKSVSKKAFDVDGLGDKQVRYLVNEMHIHKMSAIFTLSRNDLSKLPNTGLKKIDRLERSIKKASRVKAYKFLVGCNIPLVGETVSKLLCERFKISEISGLCYEDIVNINGVGDTIAKSIIKFFSNSSNMLDYMNLQLACSIDESNINIVVNEDITGKVFVITGTSDTIDRINIIDLLRKHGGKVSNRVSKKTDVLIKGKGGGKKYLEAKKINIPIWSFNELLGKFE